MEEQTEQVKLTCILHITGTKATGTVKKFDDSSWAKVQKAKAARLSLLGASKYGSLCSEIPDQYSPKDGYHSMCYKNFTAVKNVQLEEKPSNRETTVPLLRSTVTSHVATTSGILKPTCIFCKQERKRYKDNETLGICETFEAEKSLKDAARILHDDEFLALYEDIDFIAKEVKYHHSCRKNYLSKANREKQRHEAPVTDYAHNRNAHEKAFENICDYIETFVIGQKRSEFLTSIHTLYLSYLEEHGINESCYHADKLRDKLVNQYELLVSKSTNKEGSVLHHVSLSKDEAIKCARAFATSQKHAITQMALKLRHEITNLLKSSHELPRPLTTESLQMGEVQLPDTLLHFFRVLSTGSEKVAECNSRTERYARTASADAVFAATKGIIKPGKHICLGLGLKSMTGSRKVLDIMNHFGYCIHYNTAEEIETELAEQLVEKGDLPDGMHRLPDLATGLAFDNYDENTETLSGAGTLHDTFGICYQNIPVNDELYDVQRPQDHEEATRRKKKRSLTVSASEIEPYRKKPKIVKFEFPIKEPEQPSSVKSLQRRDLLWMMSTTESDSVPMWIGWNSLLSSDSLPQQKVGYLKNICLPPTRLDVVSETLRISTQLSEDCGQSYAIVTYDLAVAKPALKIQETESPKFDNVFICFGAFHIILAYFASLGFLLADSGGPEILVEAGVLAHGSLHGFLAGRHYNRCKRLHPLLANAFQVLHFRSFLRHHGPIPEAFLQYLHDLNNRPSPEALEQFEKDDVYNAVMQKYEDYTEATRDHVHGTTAAYWILYIDLVHLYLLFSRSVRTNNLDLFVYCLVQMCGIFFATSHQNYARYMVLYSLKLMNIETSHPGAKEILEAGALSVKRTGKAFSRNAVDLTLEQTVNANAASRRTGIAAFTKSEAARQRWMVTHAARSDIVSKLLEMAGLRKKEDCTAELESHRVRRDNQDMNKVISQIQDTLNPFETVADDNLYCLTTGKATSEEVKTSLLHLQDTGNRLCAEFKAECFRNPERFEKPIKKSKIKNFSSDAVKVKLTTKDKKIQELQGTRDLFGRLLYLSVEKNVDLEKVFSYPLTPVPLSLAHIDGTPHKTNKSTLMHLLEKRVHTEAPACVDVAIADAMFVIRSEVDLPNTFGGIAKAILKRILLPDSTRSDFVCDTYSDVPYIKDVEHEARGASSSHFMISGSEQKRPKDFNSHLGSKVFKRALLCFLVEEWQRPCYARVLQGHELYVGFEDKAYLYVAEGNQVVREEVPELACSHQEADTRIAWHVKHAAQRKADANVVVRCSDTDILVILLTHAHSFQAAVYLDVGHSSNNTRRYIDVTTLAQSLGISLCLALPGYHAMTGCDYTAAFYRKGKVRPFTLMETKFLQYFGSLGDNEELDEDLLVHMEQFVCSMYGKPGMASVNLARSTLFHQHYAPKEQCHPLEKLKGTEASSLPPCSDVLLQKVKRANLVASMYKKATSRYPLTWKPEDHGWVAKAGRLEVQWFTGRQLPDEVAVHIDEHFEETTDELGYHSSSDESDDEA